MKGRWLYPLIGLVVIIQALVLYLAGQPEVSP